MGRIREDSEELRLREKSLEDRLEWDKVGLEVLEGLMFVKLLKCLLRLLVFWPNLWPMCNLQNQTPRLLSSNSTIN